MSLSDIDYSARAKKADLNTYFIAEGDSDYNIRIQSVIPANPTCNCYSIAKSFAVLAVGLLFDKGLLTPNTKVIEILGDLFPENYDVNWDKVTLHHIMTHRIGLEKDCIDIDNVGGETYPINNDYLGCLLSKKLVNTPGSSYLYTDAGFYLLSRIVERASGMDPANLLRPILMNVMGFKEFAWSVCPLGFCVGATGLYVRTNDLVKLGILYLNGGIWKDQRIVSQKWIDIVLREEYEFHLIGNGWYHKGGLRGQMLAFNPKLNRAVAWHSFDNVAFEKIIGE